MAGGAPRLLSRGSRTAAANAEIARHRWLVLAPHPDDETLGAGPLIARLCQGGQAVAVAFLTDGAASHPGSASYPPAVLKRARRREAFAALRALAGSRSRIDPVFLDWPDAAPYAASSPAFESAVGLLAAICRRDRITALATTWRGEPHCDHAAAFAVADAVARAGRGRIALYQYLVWGWTEAGAGGGLRPLLLDARRSRGRRRMAMARHRSQTQALIADSPDAFRLSQAMIRFASRPYDLFFARGQYRAAPALT